MSEQGNTSPAATVIRAEPGECTTYRASIIIASYNRRDDVLECLESLPPDLLRRHDAEVIVADDGSHDGTPGGVQARFPHARLLVNETNRGPSYSRNRAARAARGSLLIFIDSDVVVQDEWLTQMLHHYDGDTILIGRTVDYNGGRTQSGPRRATFLGRSLPCAPERVNTGASCNLAIPRNRFVEIGGFDEELPYYFEDSDLCIRARKAGCRFKYLTDAVVRHKGTEFMTGRALYNHEKHCDYAMLKAYRRNPLMILLFTSGTLAWAAFRAVRFSLRGQLHDAGCILRGLVAGYRRFLVGEPTRKEA